MQKELGRYLFSVFLEKRKIDRHLNKYPPNLRKIHCGNVHSLIYFGKVEIHFQIRFGTFLKDDIATILSAIKISKIMYQTLQ